MASFFLPWQQWDPIYGARRPFTRLQYRSQPEKAVDRQRLNSWITLLANLGVLGGLVFVGLEIQQNTSQLRADASQAITESVNQLNAGVYGDPTLADVLLRGEQDLGHLGWIR